MLRGTTRSGSSVPRRIPERNENMETLESHSSAASTAALWQPETVERTVCSTVMWWDIIQPEKGML